MVIQLSEESEQIVRDMMEGGRYPSESELIGEALRLLEEREEQAKLEALRRDVAQAIEEADRGELLPCDPQAILAEVRARQSSMSAQS